MKTILEVLGESSVRAMIIALTTAFVLRVQHDLSYAEIARILASSEVAVKVKVHRARKKMLAACSVKEVA